MPQELATLAAAALLAAAVVPIGRTMSRDHRSNTRSAVS